MRLEPRVMGQTGRIRFLSVWDVKPFRETDLGPLCVSVGTWFWNIWHSCSPGQVPGHWGRHGPSLGVQHYVLRGPGVSTAHSPAWAGVTHAQGGGGLERPSWHTLLPWLHVWRSEPLRESHPWAQQKVGVQGTGVGARGAGWSKTPTQSVESCLQYGNKSVGVNSLVHVEEERVMIKHDRYETLGETTLWAARKRGGAYPWAACCSDVKAFLPPCGLWQEPASLAGALVVLLPPRPQ